MRNEQEMLELILSMAREDERIRAVIMNGSRVNPDAPRDIFQDYDIVFIVSAVEGFVRDRTWISRFGELIILQTPDEMGSHSPENKASFAFLMLFTDGNRIDLTFYPVDKWNDSQAESLSLVLLDKDSRIGPLKPPSNRDYITVPPNAKQFAHCCNEFWWVSTYIAKGLWRGELSYAKYMFEHPVRDMLMLMLQWHIGVKSGFAVDPGKQGRYYEKYLEPELWEAFKTTYSAADYEDIWQALFLMGQLFRETAIGVANHLGYEYPFEEDKRVTGYLSHVKTLPKDSL
jgi:aminoglycoside 6-adenylyltransferase